MHVFFFCYQKIPKMSFEMVQTSTNNYMIIITSFLIVYERHNDKDIIHLNPGKPPSCQYDGTAKKNYQCNILLLLFLCLFPAFSVLVLLFLQLLDCTLC